MVTTSLVFTVSINEKKKEKENILIIIESLHTVDHKRYSISLCPRRHYIKHQHLIYDNKCLVVVALYERNRLLLICTVNNRRKVMTSFFIRDNFSCHYTIIFKLLNSR